MATFANELRARARCAPPTSIYPRSTALRKGSARVPRNLDFTCVSASANERLPDVESKKRVRLYTPEAITNVVSSSLIIHTAGDIGATRAVDLEQGRTHTGKFRFVGIDREG